MDISGVTIDDIDCAHRVGDVTDKGKQTMLVRFFARDLVQLILKTRTILKGSPFVIFEDMPVLSRRLLKTVKDNPKVEAAWCQNGAIWAKPKGKTTRKLKFKLGDDVTKKIVAQIANPSRNQPVRPPRTHRRNTSSPINQDNPIMHMSHPLTNSHMSMINSTTSPKQVATNSRHDSYHNSTHASTLTSLTSTFV